jgi:glutathionyl-hydroquinone reductase
MKTKNYSKQLSATVTLTQYNKMKSICEMLEIPFSQILRNAVELVCEVYKEEISQLLKENSEDIKNGKYNGK